MSEIQPPGTASIAPVLPSEPVEIPAPVGGLEHAIMEATLDLEEAAESSRAAGRRSRSLARDSQREAIAHRRQAAKWTMVSGVVSGACSAAGAAVGATQGAQSQTYSQLGQGVGGAVGAGITFKASRHETRAESAELAATELRDCADEEQESTERSTRFADRAQQHLEEIARAKHEAMMAALRG